MVAACVVLATLTGALSLAAPPKRTIAAEPTARRQSPSTTTTTAAPTTTTLPPAPTTTAPPPPPPPPPQVDAALAEQLSHAVAEVAAGRHVAVSVARADGAVLVAHNGDVGVLPASTQKTVTAAAALVRLGGGFRYVTRVATTAAPDGGAVAGDLVLVGSGDPALAGPDFAAIRPNRPRTPLEALADAVAASGIRRIAGRVVGDASVFPHQPAAPGWLDAYIADGDTAPSSGLTADAGRRIWHGPGGYESEVVSDPARQAAAALTTLLRQRGVAVEGEAAASPTSVAAPHVVGEVASPPLGDLLRHMMQESDNQFADAIFRTIGLQTGDASWKGAAAAVRVAVAELQVEGTGLAIADGSGLSRDNRLTTDLLLAVDAAVLRTGHAPLWKELPAVAAASGTLKRRLIGTAADHRVRGKTGSLRDVNALAGSVFAAGQPRWRFAVVGNSLDPNGKRVVRDLQDAVALILSEAAVRCEPSGCTT